MPQNRSLMNFDNVVESMGMNGMFRQVGEILENLFTPQLLAFPIEVRDKITELATEVIAAQQESYFEERNRLAIEIGRLMHENSLGIGGFSSLAFIARCINDKISPMDFFKVVTRQALSSDTEKGQ